jgi:hypothetical protein
MQKQLLILACVLTVILPGCGQNRIKTKEPLLSSSPLLIDTSIIVVIPFDTTQNWGFRNCKPAYLTNDDLTKIDELIRECIDNYNTVQERQYDSISTKNLSPEIDKKNFIIDLSRYKRQYITVINKKGEKEVWINCFCNTWDKNWREGLIIVMDGGNCYFNLKINLARREYYELMVNGDA